MNASEKVKLAINEAVWNGEINQVTTKEVAEKFGCSLLVARRHLLRIVRKTSGDDRFGAASEQLAVTIKDGSMFTCNALDMQGNPSDISNPLKHYVWFLT